MLYLTCKINYREMIVMKWFEEELNGAIAQQEMMEIQQEIYEEHMRIMQIEFAEAEIKE
jgi:hypothetical protein